MQKYTKIYLDAHGYGDFSKATCLVCGKQATEIHHIRGRLGKLLLDVYNLIAVCRTCHEKYGQRKQYISYLNHIVKDKLERK